MIVDLDNTSRVIELDSNHNPEDPIEPDRVKPVGMSGFLQAPY
jgi:hypothetical protein